MGNGHGVVLERAVSGGKDTGGQDWGVPGREGGLELGVCVCIGGARVDVGEGWIGGGRGGRVSAQGWRRRGLGRGSAGSGHVGGPGRSWLGGRAGVPAPPSHLDGVDERGEAEAAQVAQPVAQQDVEEGPDHVVPGLPAGAGGGGRPPPGGLQRDGRPRPLGLHGRAGARGKRNRERSGRGGGDGTGSHPAPSTAPEAPRGSAPPPPVGGPAAGARRPASLRPRPA